MSTPRLGIRIRRGVGLIDALIALAILAFGLLAMTRLQVNLVRQASDGQVRAIAAQLGDELLSTLRLDVLPDSAPCYTLPATGTCPNAVAKARADDWRQRALAALPGAAEAGATLANNRLTVRLSWTGKESNDVRSLEATTDVRP